MAWSRTASPQRADPEPTTVRERPHRWSNVVSGIVASRAIVFVLVGAVLFLLARSLQEPGHGWGDDFALYINQARGLSDGTVATVVGDTRFAIDNSAYSSFSPTAYPWGFPALLSPMLAAGGIEYAVLKLIPTLSFVGGVLVLYLLVESRLSRVEAVAVAAFFGLNVWYLGRTDQVLSDLTFWFLMVLTLYVLDRAVRAGRLLAGNGALAAGLCAFAAFNVRREGVLLLGALAAAQAVALVVGRRSGRRPIDRSQWRAVLSPYAAFAAGTIVMQLARPAPILNPSEDVGASGLQHIQFNVAYYRDPLAEMLGLKDAGPGDPTLFGSTGLAYVALAVVLGLAVVGVVAAIVRQPSVDLHLVVALVLIGMAVLTQPFREGRYLITLVPLILYFTLRGARTLLAPLAPLGARQVGLLRAAVPTLLLVPLLLSLADDTRHAFDYHREYEYVSWGPDAPDARGLWEAVETYTDARDVVVFFQARTMNLYTRRRAIQGNSIPMMVERGDWYAMSRDSDYIQTPLTDEQAASLGFARVWENPSFVLWKIP